MRPFVIGAVILTAAAYMSPSLIAYARAVPRTRAVVRLNVLRGWTGAGWAQALGMALVRPPAAGPGPGPAAAAGVPAWRTQAGSGLLDPPGRAGPPPLFAQARLSWPSGPVQGGPQAARPPGWLPCSAAQGGALGPVQRYPGSAAGVARQPNGPAVAGMVLGILAVIFEWFGLITLATAAAAVVLGAVGVNRAAATGSGRRQGIAAITLGGTGLAAYAFWGAISMGLLWFI